MRALVVSLGLLAATVQPVAATGINLGWDDCPPGAGYSSNRGFSCDTNLGSHTMVGSVVVGWGIVAATANEIVLDLQTAGAILPNWWRMGNFTPGGCPGRTTTPTPSFDFTGGPFSCFDYWAGRASGGIAYFNFLGQPNRARIKLLVAIPQNMRGPIASGTEVYSFKATISNAKTVGADACTGCSEAACIVLNSIAVNQPRPEGGDKLYTNPAVNNAITWQGGLGGSCLLATPVQARTWGQVKSLYR